jgi:hypothetical protein
MNNSVNVLVKMSAIAVLGGLLQACATAPVIRQADAISKNVLKANSANEKLSPVVLSIVHNVDRMYSTVMVESLTEKTAILQKNKIYSLNLVNEHISRSTLLFSGKLPAGEYRFIQLQSFTPGMSYSLNLEKSSSRLGTFTVAEGKTTDLGQLILTHANSAYVLARSQTHTSNQNLVARTGKELQQAIYANTELTGWNQPVAEFDQLAEKYASALPFGMRCIREQQSSSLLAASNMGSVYSLATKKQVEPATPLLQGSAAQQSQEKSRVYTAPDNYFLECVNLKESNDFDFLAYGEMNALYKHVRGSDTLTAIDTGNLPTGIIFSVVGNNRDGWFLGSVIGSMATIYHSDSLEKGDWQVVVSKKVQDSWLGLNGIWMWEDEQGFDYADMYGSIHRYSYSTKAWTENKVPGNANISRLAVSGDKSVSVITSKAGFGGVFANQYISQDHGANWKKIDSPFKVNVWPPQSSIEGDLYIAGGGFSWGELAVSEDSGKTWQKRNIMPWSYITVLPSGKLLNTAFSSPLSVVDYSVDKGKSWTRLYSTFNRKLAEQQKQAKAASK